MIAVDTNVLVAAHRQDAPRHSAAVDALGALASGASTWAVPWPCLHEFLAVVTHPRIFDPPSTLAQALDQLAAWLAAPNLVLLAESLGYAERLHAVISVSGVVGPRIHDARIAALCLHHRVDVLWTADRDFSRFADLRVIDPLASAG